MYYFLLNVPPNVLLFVFFLLSIRDLVVPENFTAKFVLDVMLVLLVIWVTKMLPALHASRGCIKMKQVCHCVCLVLQEWLSI